MNQSKKIDDEVQLLKSSLEKLEDVLNDHLLHIPNLPHPTCPIGDSDKDNNLIEKLMNQKCANKKNMQIF